MRIPWTRTAIVRSLAAAILSGLFAASASAQEVCVPSDSPQQTPRICVGQGDDGGLIDLSQLDDVSSPGAATLNALIAAVGEDRELSALADAIGKLTNDEDLARAAKQLAPETNFAVQQAALSLNSIVGQLIGAQLDVVNAFTSAPDFEAPSGLGMKQKMPNRYNLGAGVTSRDSIAPGREAMWAQAFGAILDQDRRDHVDGYDADLYGGLVGYDNLLSPTARIGVAIGYGNASIDGSGDTSRNATDIDSYLVELYGAVKGEGWYVSGRTGYAWHSYDTLRVVDVPISDRAVGDYDGQQFNAAIELGAPNRVNGFIVTPVASLTYSYLEQDAYTETSGLGIALAISEQRTHSLVSGLGVKALAPLSPNAALEARAIWLHEFADDSQSVTAAFAAGGGSFTASGPAVGRDTADLGIRLIGQINPGATFEINYDANIRPDYVAHVGSTRLVFGF
ncbi:MAG: autotransporter outer membrane beta-barrel domain-containing protein [Hyphomicrobium sp.]